MCPKQEALEELRGIWNWPSGQDKAVWLQLILGERKLIARGTQRRNSKVLWNWVASTQNTLRKHAGCLNKAVLGAEMTTVSELNNLDFSSLKLTQLPALLSIQLLITASSCEPAVWQQALRGSVSGDSNFVLTGIETYCIFHVVLTGLSHTKLFYIYVYIFIHTHISIYKTKFLLHINF